jgi:hypothetical protein
MQKTMIMSNKMQQLTPREFTAIRYVWRLERHELKHLTRFYILRTTIGDLVKINPARTGFIFPVNILHENTNYELHIPEGTKKKIKILLTYGGLDAPILLSMRHSRPHGFAYALAKIVDHVPTEDLRKYKEL